jgi:hypothetical protein
VLLRVDSILTIMASAARAQAREGFYAGWRWTLKVTDRFQGLSSRSKFNSTESHVLTPESGAGAAALPMFRWPQDAINK